LKKTGFVEGLNVAIEFRWAEGQYDRASAMAAELVRRQVAAIVSSTGSGRACAAANNASSALRPAVRRRSMGLRHDYHPDRGAVPQSRWPQGLFGPGQLYDGEVDGRTIVIRSTQPLLDGCRALLVDGVDPATRIVMRLSGSAVEAVKSTVGAAGLTVEEGGRVPTFRPWKPSPRAAATHRANGRGGYHESRAFGRASGAAGSSRRDASLATG
jgi:hypothetical protein